MSLFSFLEGAGGAPAELYVFQRGQTVWRYTSGPTAVTVSGLAYHPATIQREEVERDAESALVTLTVRVARQVPVVADAFEGLQPALPVTLTVFRLQRDATDTATAGTGRAVVFQGTAGAPKRDGRWAEFTVRGARAGLERAVPRTRLTVLCNNTLGDRVCQLDTSAFTIAATVSALTGLVATVPAATQAAGVASGFFTNGVLQYGDYRIMVAHHGTTAGVDDDQLTLLTPLPPAAVGVVGGVALTAGCDGSRAQCVSRFNNLARFRGFPYLPATTPWRTMR